MEDDIAHMLNHSQKPNLEQHLREVVISGPQLWQETDCYTYLFFAKLQVLFINIALIVN